MNAEPLLLQIGQTLRYSRELPAEVRLSADGYVNFSHAVHRPGSSRAQLEAGINRIAMLDAADGRRRPAILISSSPHKVGSADTPWHDVFDPDNGHIRYFGDAKTPGHDPATPAGNRSMLEAFTKHSALSFEERLASPPLIYFRRRSVGGAVKGYAEFQRFGVIERAELITQFDRQTGRSFTNYVYDLAVFSMAQEHELFDWSWINARRDPSLTSADTLKLAPAAWRRWIKDGPSAISRNRRHVSKLRVVRREDQLPKPGSKQAKLLQEICAHYSANKHGFEALAYVIVRRMLSQSAQTFIDGWITPRSGDSGADFIGGLDLGKGFGAVRQIVFGQAKCVGPDSGVNGKDIARTAARLKRGWFGAFVTTSYFSEPVQREVIEDEYPLLLVNGRSVVEHAAALVEESGKGSLQAYLTDLDAASAGMIARRRPEEILHF